MEKKINIELIWLLLSKRFYRKNHGIPCEHESEFGSRKEGEKFLDEVINYQFLKKKFFFMLLEYHTVRLGE
jgi:hypothetical protein